MALKLAISRIDINLIIDHPAFFKVNTIEPMNPPWSARRCFWTKPISAFFWLIIKLNSWLG